MGSYCIYHDLSKEIYSKPLLALFENLFRNVKNETQYFKNDMISYDSIVFNVRFNSQ